MHSSRAPRPSPATPWILLVALVAPSAPLVAQTVLEYDHATRKAWLIRPRAGSVDTIPAGTGTRLALPAPGEVQVRVINTNTALYRISQRAQAVPAGELEPIRSFLGTLRPYLPEVAFLAAGAPKALDPNAASPAARSILPERLASGTVAGIRSAWEAGQATERLIANIDARVSGEQGLRQTLTQTLLALQQMRTGAPVQAAAGSLRATLDLPGDGCAASPARIGQLPVTLALVEALEGLARARWDLQRAIALNAAEIRTYDGWPGLSDSLARIARAAEAASLDDDKLVAAAYRIQTLALTTAYACPTWSGDAVRLARGTGQTVTIALDPRPEPELARVADRGGTAYTMTLTPQWRVRPSLGGSFLVTADARFPRYGARTAATGGATEVFESGVQDARFSWGVSLGFAWRPLTMGGGEKPDVAIWLPELTVNPTGDVRAFGIGAGISWKFLKLGSGLLWIRHSELHNLTVGQVLPNKDFLRIRDTYADPQLYISLSVFDWPPFTAK